MKKTLCLLLVLLGCLLTGCAPGSTAAGSALVHPKFPYAVTYDDEQAKSILGPDWALENYRRKGVDPKRPGVVEIERKEGYDTTYHFDFDDNGKYESSEVFPNPDLLLASRRTEARIEVSTLLLDKRLADKELRVLLNDAVESASGTLSLFVGFGSTAVAGSKRFASRLLDSQEVQLGAEKGLVATIERANVDQLQLNPNARWRRSRLFLMRAPFQHFAALGGRFEPYRVLLLVEYSNAPEDFEAQYPEFLRLMNKIHIMDDQLLAEYLVEQLAACSKDKTDLASVVIDIAADGRTKLRGTVNLPRACVQSVIGPYRFPGSGQPRSLTVTCDFTKQLRPAWLSRGQYAEQRVALAPAAPPAAPAASESAGTAPAQPVAPPDVAAPAPAASPVPPPAAPAPPAVPAPRSDAGTP